MEKFLWGVSTAAAQVEGGYNKDGRSLSIWDVASLTGRITDGHSTFNTCNTYNNVAEDVKILKQLGANSYRFSLSWSRILPNGTGDINKAGVKYYNELIDGLLKNDIEPFVTLYHWDLPQCLMNKGGLLNEDFADWFEYYAAVCAKTFGNRVRYFTTFNEPECICDLGYGKGLHAPYINGGIEKAVIAAHNLLRANGKACKAIKKYSANGVKVGIVLACSPKMPDKETDIESARTAMFQSKGDNLFNNIWFTDAILFGRYPENILNGFSRKNIYGIDDMTDIKIDIDFIGLNVYQAERITTLENGGYKAVFQPLNTLKSSSGSNCVPQCVYYAAKYMSERYNGIPIYITENGMSLPDTIGLDGKVNDDARELFIDGHVKEVVKAKKDGINLCGYFHWSLYDNLEWNSGFSERFGVVYTDFKTYEKIPKKSFRHYAELIDRYRDL